METIHIGKIVQEKFQATGHTISWLAKQINCDRSNIYHIFKRPSMDCDLLYKISCALKYDFFQYYRLEFEE